MLNAARLLKEALAENPHHRGAQKRLDELVESGELAIAQKDRAAEGSPEPLVAKGRRDELSGAETEKGWLW